LEAAVAGRSYAIVIGVCNYENVPTLKYAAKDAKEVASALALTAFKDELVVLHDDEEGGATPPERHRIFHELGHLKNRGLDADDSVLFYFSGHGLMNEGVDYLLPLEASDEALEDTAVPVETAVRRLRETGSKQVVMMIDACRDEMPTGKGVHGIGANTKSVVEDIDEGVAVVFSCKSRERSYEIEHEDVRHSSFTHCLLQAIKGPKTNTLDEVATFLREEVKILNSKHHLRAQEPYLVARPEVLKDLAIFALLEQAVSLDLERSIEFFFGLREQNVLEKTIWYDVMTYLGRPEQLDDLRRALIQDLCDLESSPDDFQTAWKLARSRAASQKRVVAGPASLGEPSQLPLPKPMADDA
jgi:hypothetical protein